MQRGKDDALWVIKKENKRRKIHRHVHILFINFQNLKKRYSKTAWPKVHNNSLTFLWRVFATTVHCKYTLSFFPLNCFISEVFNHEHVSSVLAFKNRSSKICGIKPLKKLKHHFKFLKAAHRKFYLVRSWILCFISSQIPPLSRFLRAYDNQVFTWTWKKNSANVSRNKYFASFPLKMKTRIGYLSNVPRMNRIIFKWLTHEILIFSPSFAVVFLWSLLV